MFFQNMKYRNSVYRRLKQVMQLYPRGVDSILTVYPNIAEIVVKYRERGKSPESLGLYIASLIITRELSLLSDEERFTIWLQLREMKVKELLDFVDRPNGNIKSTSSNKVSRAHYVGWALYSGRKMLNEDLIDAEDYRLFRSEIYSKFANLVSEDRRAERIMTELDSIVHVPWDFAGKQLATEVRLGITYLTGDGVGQDYAEALKHFTPAAEQRNVYAETLLASMYENGNGVAQDYGEAERCYRLAAQLGYAEAQLGLGGMYLKGQAVPQDDAEALRWFQSAAEQGHDPSQAMLGAIYEHSERDYVQAHVWYSLAAARGNEPATKDRDLLAEKMTPDQIAESQQLAGEREPKSGSEN